MTTAPEPAVQTAMDPLADLTPEQRDDLVRARQQWKASAAAAHAADVGTVSDELAARRARRATGSPSMAGHTAAKVFGLRARSAPPHLWPALAGHKPDPKLIADADRLEAEMDAQARREREERQRANRHAAYLRLRPERYATVSYATLRPEQNPRGLVTSWLARGPRALLLAGNSRTGKSTAAYAIANDAHAQGLWVVAVTATALHEACLPTQRDKDTPGEVWVPSRRDPNAFMRAGLCDLLVLDDLGREQVSPWWRSQLQELLDMRVANNRRTIVTANTPIDPARAYDVLLDRYGDPVVERILDGGGIVIFDGPPIRHLVTEW